VLCSAFAASACCLRFAKFLEIFCTKLVSQSRTTTNISLFNNTHMSGQHKGRGEHVVKKQALDVPKDPAGFTVAFDVAQEAEIQDFFNKFGFVVVRDVLTQEACNNTLDEIYSILENGTKFKRNDVGTWSSWPADSIEVINSTNTSYICYLFMSTHICMEKYKYITSTSPITRDPLLTLFTEVRIPSQAPCLHRSILEEPPEP
jgi:hypothetical protein